MELLELLKYAAEAEQKRQESGQITELDSSITDIFFGTISQLQQQIWHNKETLWILMVVTWIFLAISISTNGLQFWYFHKKLKILEGKISLDS